jgi:hypothetical protein
MRSENGRKVLPEDAPVQPVSRALRYRLLAGLWCLVSPPALFLILREPAWRQAAGFRQGVLAVRVEQWVAIGLLLCHGWFLWRAWRLACAERRLPRS